MSDAHGAEGHAGPAVKTYLIVFVILCICTALSFIAFEVFGRNPTSFSIILTVAVIKAVIVATFFMHLIVDWRKLYYMIIPALILAVPCLRRE